MIESVGYKAFRGTMQISGLAGTREIRADWLYKPEHDCWYGKGCSYPAEICDVAEDET